MCTKFRQWLMVLAAALSVDQVQAVTTKEMLESAPVFQILLDNSGSSPASSEAFVATAWPVIESKLRLMPMGTVVIVNTVGDASLSPLMKRTRIQKIATSEGASMDEVVQGLRAIVLGFPKRVHGEEHGQSHLVGGLFDASKNINTKASRPNVIVMLSDLIEFSPLANCYRNRACSLPSPTFRLDNTNVVALGVGRGLPSNHEMAIFASWEKFLGEAKSTYELKKTF